MIISTRFLSLKEEKIMIFTNWFEKRKKEKQRKLKIKLQKKYLLVQQLEVLVDY